MAEAPPEPPLSSEELATLRRFIETLRGASEGEIDVLARFAVSCEAWRGRPAPRVRREDTETMRRTGVA